MRPARSWWSRPRRARSRALANAKDAESPLRKLASAQSRRADLNRSDSPKLVAAAERNGAEQIMQRQGGALPVRKRRRFLERPLPIAYWRSRYRMRLPQSGRLSRPTDTTHE